MRPRFQPDAVSSSLFLPRPRIRWSPRKPSSAATPKGSVPANARMGASTLDDRDRPRDWSSAQASRGTFREARRLGRPRIIDDLSFTVAGCGDIGAADPEWDGLSTEHIGREWDHGHG